MSQNFIEEVAMWGGPPGSRPTPASAYVFSGLAEPEPLLRRGRGRPPHRDLCRELLTQDTSARGQRLGADFTLLGVLSDWSGVFRAAP